MGGGGGRMDLAFVFGYVGDGMENFSSDVDMVVISNSVSGSELILGIRSAERQLGREVNPSLYKRDEFRSRVAEGHHFLANVLRGRKLFLIGDEDELGRLAEVRVAQGTQDEPKRDRRTSGRRRS